MAINLLITIPIFIGTVFFGFLIGYVLSKRSIKKQNKKLVENFNEFLDGKRDNFVEFDGVKYSAEKFLVRNEEGNEIIIDLKGGRIEPKEYGTKEEKQKDKKPSKGNKSITNKNSRSPRKRKRNHGKRTDRRRRRRFG